MSSRILPKALVLALTVASPACYRYIPTQYEAIPAGENVQVWVTPAAADSIEAKGSLVINEPRLRGIVAEKSNGGMTLQVPVSQRQEGFHSAPIYQNEILAQRDILSIEKRVFDRTGTAALIAGTVAGAGVVIFVIMNAYGEPPGEDICESDCTDLMAPVLPKVGRRIPIFSIPVP